MCVTVPNFVKIGGTAADIWSFNGFQNGGRLPPLISKIHYFNGLDG